MFLDHTHSIGTVLETAAQAMLNDLDVETLREAVIRPTIIPVLMSSLLLLMTALWRASGSL